MTVKRKRRPRKDHAPELFEDDKQEHKQPTPDTGRSAMPRLNGQKLPVWWWWQ